jgi:hypothetical protein
VRRTDEHIGEPVAVDVTRRGDRGAEPVTGRGAVDPEPARAQRAQLGGEPSRGAEDHIHAAGVGAAAGVGIRRPDQQIAAAVAVDVARRRHRVAGAVAVALAGQPAVGVHGEVERA